MSAGPLSHEPPNWPPNKEATIARIMEYYNEAKTADEVRRIVGITHDFNEDLWDLDVGSLDEILAEIKSP